MGKLSFVRSRGGIRKLAALGVIFSLCISLGGGK
jgi:hypothetical protein